MPSYEDLDAFKACHQLTLAVHKVTEGLDEKDPELSAQLWGAALIAPSRIARGSAFRNRKMFWVCVDRSVAALYEIEYHLKMGYTMGLISKEDHQNLESLRGRAVFYTMKLVMDLIAPPPPPEPDDDNP
ncbi:MAG TPA: four helix bundle protein [Gemmatimonadales bacterium]|nr:four helix bundle protein [Gemmatimonadales bacterium]